MERTRGNPGPDEVSHLLGVNEVSSSDDTVEMHPTGWIDDFADWSNSEELVLYPWICDSILHQAYVEDRFSRTVLRQAPERNLYHMQQLRNRKDCSCARCVWIYSHLRVMFQE